LKTPRLETKRLLLRAVKSDDVDSIYKCWMQDEDISRYMCWKASSDIEDTKKFVKYELTQIENNQWNRWIIILKETAAVIGTCLVFYNEAECNWDISYNLGKKYWGNGYALEAMKKVLAYASQKLGMRECIAVHAIQNPASGKVISKLGFSFEKEVPYECNGGEIHTVGAFYRLRISAGEVSGKGGRNMAGNDEAVFNIQF